MGKRSVAILGLVAGVACDNEYPLAPTRCDDYCFALQRADCPEDWPDQCVTQCEFFLSPTRFPNCEGEFDVLVGCYQALDDDDFECVSEESEARVDRCEDEQFQLGACIDPILFRELTRCERLIERCPYVELHLCLMSRADIQPGCEEEGIRYLDCELAQTTGCGRSPNCETLEDELLLCGYPGLRE